MGGRAKPKGAPSTASAGTYTGVSGVTIPVSASRTTLAVKPAADDDLPEV